MKIVVVLETMWDWRSRTSGAGYAQAVPWFRINPENHTGRRLHKWLAHHDPGFLTTNACPQLVQNAKQHGTPDREWLNGNLRKLAPMDLVLVCGKVAQATYDRTAVGDAKIIELPHPAFKSWTREGIALVGDVVTRGVSARIVHREKQFFEECLA